MTELWKQEDFDAVAKMEHANLEIKFPDEELYGIALFIEAIIQSHVKNALIITPDKTTYIRAL